MEDAFPGVLVGLPKLSALSRSMGATHAETRDFALERICIVVAQEVRIVLRVERPQGRRARIRRPDRLGVDLVLFVGLETRLAI